jgi:rubrerythrin
MSEPVLKPIEAGKLFLESSKENRFRIFCTVCNGWVFWQEGQVECPSCGRPNAEAYALNLGVRQALEARAAPTPV